MHQNPNPEVGGWGGRLDIPQDIFISPMCPDYKSYFGNVPGLLVKIIDYELPMCQIIHWKCARLISKD